MIIFVIFLQIQINIAIKDLAITLGPLTSQQSTYVVYQDEKLNEQFDIGNMIWTNCAPLNLMYFKSNLNQQNAQMPLQIINMGNKDILLQKISLSTLDRQSLKVQLNKTSNILIEKNKIQVFDIQYFCEKKLTKQNYWAVIEIQMILNTDSLTFHYQYICDSSFHPKRFDWSYVILIVLMSLFVLILSRQQKLSAFKVTYYSGARTEKDTTIFQGFHLGFQSSIVYNMVFFFGIFSAYIFQKKVENIEENVVRFFCLVFGFILVSEICYKIKFLKIKILCRIRACDIIGILISVMTMHIYVQNNEPWILSNLLTLFLVGTSIKIFKITSLQNALYFFIPCIIMDIAFSVYGSFYIRYEWDSLVMKYFNTPMTAQFPYFYPIYKKRCGWLSITSILFPAFFLAYAHRFDRFRDSIIYRMISFFGLLLGLILWLIFTSIYSVPLPVSSFTLFPTIGISALIAFQRNEIKTFWTGNFYDQVLQNPWRHQMERESIHQMNFLRPIELQVLNSNQNTQSLDQLIRLSQGKVKFNDSLFDGLLEH